MSEQDNLGRVSDEMRKYLRDDGSDVECHVSSRTIAVWVHRIDRERKRHGYIAVRLKNARRALKDFMRWQVAHLWEEKMRMFPHVAKRVAELTEANIAKRAAELKEASAVQAERNPTE